MKLDQWMKQEGLTRREVAERLQCSEGAVHRWARGDRHPSLIMMSRIARLSCAQVQLEDFVEDEYVPSRRKSDKAISDAQILDWLRGKGYRAISILLAETPGIPFSRSVLIRYMRQSTLPRWKVKKGGRGKPSQWLGLSALDVSDSFRTLQSLRGKTSPVTLHIEEVIE